jgi:hypothetical protein
MDQEYGMEAGILSLVRIKQSCQHHKIESEDGEVRRDIGEPVVPHF